MRAELILGLCDRFHCLPSQLLAEDVQVMKLLAIANYGVEPAPEPARPVSPDVQAMYDMETLPLG